MAPVKKQIFLLMLVAWLWPSTAAPAQNHQQVTVFAAASMKEALDELAKQFEKQGGSRVVVSYAASSALARQIERGAPADLFISADLEWMDYLAARKLVRADSRVDLVSNKLVLIAPASSRITLQLAANFPLADALGTGRLALADPASVPAGKYAMAALTALHAWDSVSSKTARAENVRAALALVARGEAPFGIVYATDALAERRVRVVGEFAAHLHPPIVYPAAIVADSKSNAVGPLLRFLRTPAARPVWQRHGFVPRG
jgi:molybdate transport system substrate-binding protein